MAIRVSSLNARLAQVVGVVCLSLGIGSSVHGDLINFQQDVSPTGAYQSIVATLNEVNPTSHGGTGSSNYIGHSASGGGGAFRSLEAFDISAIPAGSTINSVTLTLYPRGSLSSATDATYEVELHQLIGSATESNASWDNRFEDDNASLDVPWSSPGGDYNSTVLSTFDANPHSLIASTFPSTSAFVAAAQSALDGSGTLYMLVLSPDAEAVSSSTETRMNFGSDDYNAGTTESPDYSNRPLLTIDYTTIPEPSAFFLLGMGIVGAVGCARRR